jgi:hypothetical protein
MLPFHIYQHKSDYKCDVESGIFQTSFSDFLGALDPLYLLFSTKQQQLPPVCNKFHFSVSNEPTRHHRIVLSWQKHRVKCKRAPYVLFWIGLFPAIVYCLYILLYSRLVLRLTLLWIPYLRCVLYYLHQAHRLTDLWLHRHKLVMEFYDLHSSYDHLSHFYPELENPQNRGPRICTYLPPWKRSVSTRESSQLNACSYCSSK